MKRINLHKASFCRRGLLPGVYRTATLATILSLVLSENTNAQCVNANSNTFTQIPLLSSVSNPGNAYDQGDGDVTTAATLTVNGVGVATLNVSFDQNANSGDSIVVMFGVPTANILNWVLLGSTTFTPFSGTNGSGTASTAYNATSLAFLLSVGSNSLARIAIPVTAAAGAQSLKIEFVGIGAVIGKQNLIYDVAVKPGPVSTGADTTICSGATATITGSKSALAAQPVDVLWYDTDGTTVLQTNSNQTGAPYVSSYTTSALSTTKTFFVRERWNGCTLLSDPKPVVVTVRPAITPNISINCNNPVTLSATATGATSPVSYLWSATGGGNIVAGQTGAASPAINGFGNYSVTITDANTCTGTAGIAFSASDCIALQLNLVSFEVSKRDMAAVLDWKVAKAEEGALFEIERSTDGSNWTRAGIVKANTADLSYTFQDEKAGLRGGSYQYRLKVLGKDGSFTYSEIRALSFNRNDAASFYPNPVSNGQKLTLITGRPEAIKSLHIFNTAGQQVLHTTSFETINLDGMPSGLYLLQVDYVNGSKTNHKITKQ